MSRMVIESGSGGLRERLYFARLLLEQLEEGIAGQGPRARLLALRGSVLFYLYSIPVGLVRHAASSYRVADADRLISLDALAMAFQAAAVEAPEQRLVEQARNDRGDPLCWLDAEMQRAFGASGLGLRPQPPEEEAGLGLRAEDPYQPLAAGDLQRLRDCLSRVEALYNECLPYMEEW